MQPPVLQDSTNNDTGLTGDPRYSVVWALQGKQGLPTKLHRHENSCNERQDRWICS